MFPPLCIGDNHWTVLELHLKIYSESWGFKRYGIEPVICFLLPGLLLCSDWLHEGQHDNDWWNSPWYLLLTGRYHYLLYAIFFQKLICAILFVRLKGANMKVNIVLKHVQLQLDPFSQSTEHFNPNINTGKTNYWGCL